MAHILKADKHSIIQQRTALGLQLCCSCDWGPDCAKYQLIFAQNGDKLRGVPVARVSGLSATYKAKNLGWKQTLEKSLLGPIDKDSVRVARHHWSEEQLQYVAENHSAISTGVSAHVAKKTAYSFDSSAKWTHPATGVVEYFHTPNMPKKVVEEEALSLLEPRTIRKREREAIVKEQKEKAERQAFEKITFEEYKKKQQMQREMIASLKAGYQALEEENDNLKEKLRATKKENSRFKSAKRRRDAKRQKSSSDEPFDMSQWVKPTDGQVRAAAAKAAQSAAAAVQQLQVLDTATNPEGQQGDSMIRMM